MNTRPGALVHTGFLQLQKIPVLCLLFGETKEKSASVTCTISTATTKNSSNSYLSHRHTRTKWRRSKTKITVHTLLTNRLLCIKSSSSMRALARTPHSVPFIVGLVKLSSMEGDAILLNAFVSFADAA